MLEILTVCTGNICRSPLAAVILRARLADLGVDVRSAGTRGLPSAPMTPEAVDLALARGIDPAETGAHLSRYLTEAHLSTPDLILAMTREHRRAIAELAPSRLRSTFTIREFARLSRATSDDEIVAAARPHDTDEERVRAASALLAGKRGLVEPAADPADDDVIDPYGRSWKTYQVSASQLDPALDEVVRVVRLAVAANPAVAD
ncbi:low molecular weight phosphatase family protein [Microbacterium terricola]|uniref:protein-tyrosine-phosphatase n=1 Tax=Microbacterium terricola TaxID=344163 RepID=A0ABM8DVT5_9MICO|nr:low molecular weight phosphatase family protein [Microbacterium terricola]UYK39483.1 low molecular weight phosphatase family protein [Microbacterium terricola]BDV29788.1 low molecular weight phosphatase family protein [Microbacterium terricola]